MYKKGFLRIFKMVEENREMFFKAKVGKKET